MLNPTRECSFLNANESRKSCAGVRPCYRAKRNSRGIPWPLPELEDTGDDVQSWEANSSSLEGRSGLICARAYRRVKAWCQLRGAVTRWPLLLAITYLARVAWNTNEASTLTEMLWTVGLCALVWAWESGANDVSTKRIEFLRKGIFQISAKWKWWLAQLRQAYRCCVHDSSGNKALRIVCEPVFILTMTGRICVTLKYTKREYSLSLSLDCMHLIYFILDFCPCSSQLIVSP